MAQEHFPFYLERVVEHLLRRHARPVVEEVDRAIHVGIPRRARRGPVVLRDAVPQARHRAAHRPVHLQRQQVVAPHPHRPRGVELRDHAAFQFKGRVGCVVRGAWVWLPLFVEAFLHVRGPIARDRLDAAEEVVEHVAPVAEHVHDDAAIVFLAVVPARPLGRDAVRPGKNPVAETRRARSGFCRRNPCLMSCCNFIRPGSQSLSCTTPFFTPARFSRPRIIRRRIRWIPPWVSHK